MKSNILPTFYSLHRTYTNIFTIFGSAHIFYTKSNINHFWYKKKKENNTVTAAGPLIHGPGRPTHARLSSSLCRSLTGDPTSQFPLPPLAIGPAVLKHAVGEVPARVEMRSGFSFTSRPHCYHPRTLYLTLSTSAKRMADGRVGRT